MTVVVTASALSSTLTYIAWGVSLEWLHWDSSVSLIEDKSTFSLAPLLSLTQISISGQPDTKFMRKVGFPSPG